MQESNAQILVVEDDRDIRNIVSTVLKKNGYECATASTAAEGIQAFGENIRRMREKKLTFQDAIRAAEFYLVEKCRLQIVQHELFDQLEQTPFA